MIRFQQGEQGYFECPVRFCRESTFTESGIVTHYNRKHAGDNKVTVETVEFDRSRRDREMAKRTAAEGTASNESSKTPKVKQEKGLRSYRVTNADGSVTVRIKSVAPFTYRKVADGKYEGTLTYNETTFQITGKTEKSVISNAYHKVQKLAVVKTEATSAKTETGTATAPEVAPTTPATAE